MFLSLITQEERRVIESVGTRRGYRAGMALLFDHGPPTHVILIEKGHVKLTRASAEGREILLELRGPGDLVGELSAVDESQRSATATALVAVEAIVITAARFRQLLLDHPRISLAVLTMTSHKLRQAADRRLIADTSDVIAHLAGRIVELAGDRTPNEEGVIDVEMLLSQQDLADWIGSSRDAVVKALRHMRHKRWLDTGRQSISIYDLDALRREAG